MTMDACPYCQQVDPQDCPIHADHRRQAQAELLDDLQRAAQAILDISTCEDSPITGDAAMAASRSSASASAA